MTSSIIFFIVLVGLSAFFSGLEIAFFSLSPGRVRAMARKKLFGAHSVEKLKKNPQRLLVTILLGNNLVNILAASIATKVALDLFGSAGVGIATGVVTLLVLVFGEIFPKAIAQARAGTISRMTASLVLGLEYLLLPVVAILELFTKLAVAVFSRKNQPLISEDEIHSMFHLGLEEGSLEKHELEFVERLFRFNDVQLKSIITPIDKVVMMDEDSVIDQAAFAAANSGYSRFPVFSGNRDNIVGMVHVKDIFKANNSDNRDKTIGSIKNKIRKASIDEELDEVFRKLNQEKEHFLLVTGSNKEVLGLVTLEDLLEELVGEIFDESDVRKTSVTS